MSTPVTPWNGVPVNPEVRQLHVLRLGTETVIGDWRPEEQDEPCGWMGLRGYSPGLVAQVGYQYVSPVRTDADLAAAIEREERSHLATIDRRDHAEEVINELVFAVLGEQPEWSNLYQFADAVADVQARIEDLEEHVERAADVMDAILDTVPLLNAKTRELLRGFRRSARAAIRARTPTTGGQADG